MGNSIIKISNIEQLPDIDDLRHLLQSLAMLEAILMPEWQFRYYSFNSNWSEKEMMASMRNGSGDEYFAVFSDAGVFIKGYDRYSTLAGYVEKEGKPYPGIFEGLPDIFLPYLSEPALVINQTTFCIWKLISSSTWCSGQIDWNGLDASASDLNLLDMIVGGAECYQSWAEEYYEMTIHIETIKQIFSFVPLTAEMVHSLNPDISLDELQDDIKEIAYPKE